MFTIEWDCKLVLTCKKLCGIGPWPNVPYSVNKPVGYKFFSLGILIVAAAIVQCETRVKSWNQFFFNLKR